MQNHRCPTIEEFKDILKKHSLKATPQRLAVHEAMIVLGHACADMVTEEISKQGKARVTVASVYNILSQAGGHPHGLRTCARARSLDTRARARPDRRNTRTRHTCTTDEYAHTTRARLRHMCTADRRARPSDTRTRQTARPTDAHANDTGYEHTRT